ncbi:MAG: histidine phosphatase family protein [Bacteroidota bacterium]
MKTLFVIRHAKSSWKDLTLADHQRPLNKRGLRNLPQMASHLAIKYRTIDAFISSHAVRAYETAKGIVSGFQLDPTQIQIEPALYHAGPHQILNVVQSIQNDHQTAAIFGHNPGFTDFINRMTASDIDNVPTCGVAVISFPQQKWKEISPGDGKLAYYVFPKALSY